MNELFIALTKSGSVMYDKVEVVSKQGNQAQGKHERYKKQEEDVEAAHSIQFTL